MEKHPDLRTPDLYIPAISYSEEYKEEPEVVPMEINNDDIQWVATHLSRLHGLIGI